MLRLCQAWVAVRTQRFINRIPLWKRCATTMQLTHQSPCLAVCIAVSVCLSAFLFCWFLLLSGWLAAWVAALLAGGLAAWLFCWLARCVYVALLARFLCLACWLLAWLPACPDLPGCLVSWLLAWQAGWLICCLALNFLHDSSPACLHVSVPVLGLCFCELRVRI